MSFIRPILNFIFIIFILISCSNPMNKKLTKENYRDVLNEVRKKSSDEDFAKVQGLVQLMAFSSAFQKDKNVEEQLEGKTFNEIIKSMKENQEKSKTENLKTAIEEAGKEQLRQEHLDVIKWTKKNKKSGKYILRESVEIGATFQNKKTKDIDAFEGKILVFDKLGNEIMDFYIKDTDGIKAKKKSKGTWSKSVKFKGEELFRTPASKLKFKFIPTKILFKDETVL